MNSQKTLTGQFSHIQLYILTGSLPSRAAFYCWSLQLIVLQNINQICLPAHSCKGQAHYKISVLRKNESKDLDIWEKKELLKENPPAAGLSIEGQGVLKLWTARVYTDMQRLRRASLELVVFSSTFPCVHFENMDSRKVWEAQAKQILSEKGP